MNTTKAWYIRSQSGDETKGPFPGGQISQELLLGRHKLDDEVSHDKEEWIAIRDVPELVPEIFAEDRGEPGFKDRLAAARRWADERRGVDDIDIKGERRTKESYEKAEIKRLHRLANKAKKNIDPVTTFIQLSVFLTVIIVVVILAFQFSPKDETLVDCTTPASRGTNWSGCNLSGAQLFKANLVSSNLMNANLQTANLQSADLSLANLKYTQLHLANLKHANFTKANLVGADFISADLSGAIFEEANMSYANFRDAKITSANFLNARLDHAIWVDGRKCRVNSIGSCN